MFSGREFSEALSSCNVRSAPGLDGVGHGALLGLFERSKQFLLSLYPHLISECPILSEGRPRFFRFLAERFPGRLPERVDMGDLIFYLDPEAVGELGRFFRSGDLVI